MKKLSDYLPKFSAKWFGIGAGVIAISVFSFWLYLYNPKVMPVFLNSTTKTIGDKIVGQELAKKIDETRDESGATSIRTLFNTNKEENLEAHCDRKEDRDKYQEKCWQTYENAEAGYSVNVPTSLTEEKDNNLPPDFISSVLFWDPEIYKLKETTSGIFSEIEIDVFNNDSNKTSLELVNDRNNPEGFISNITEINQGPYHWIKALETGDPDHLIYLTVINSKIYQIVTSTTELSYINDVLENFKAF